MNILYQYSIATSLDESKGDCINERNFLDVLHSFADVHFARNKYDFNPKDFDIAYIRGNEQMFDYCKGIKRIWMSTPYNDRIYKEADYIATFTERWRKVLINGDVVEGINPDGNTYSNVININQTISNRFFKETTRTGANKVITIGCFGRIKETTYPNLLFKSTNRLRKIFPRFRIILGSTPRVKTMGFITAKKARMNIYKRISLNQYSYKVIPRMISSCDLIVISYDGIYWDYGGSLKTIEAAARGVPMILPRGDAREETLGSDYPYFLPIDVFRKPITNKKIKIFTAMAEKAINSKNDIPAYLKRRLYFIVLKSNQFG